MNEEYIVLLSTLAVFGPVMCEPDRNICHSLSLSRDVALIGEPMNDVKRGRLPTTPPLPAPLPQLTRFIGI